MGEMVSFRGAAEESLRRRLNLYLGLPEQTMALGIPAHVVRRNDMLVFQGFNPFETQSSIFQGVTLSERTLAACRGPAYRLSGPGQGNQVSGFGPSSLVFPKGQTIRVTKSVVTYPFDQLRTALN